MKILIFATVSALLCQDAAAIQLWYSPGALPTTIPAACRAALTTNVTCSQFVPAASISNGFYIGGNTLTSLCVSGCTSSLLSFQKGVHSACGNTSYAFSSSYTNTGNAIVDALVWAYNTTCIKSGTAFCYPQVINGTVLPCSNCNLQYGAALLNSTYGQQRINSAYFSSLISSCGVPASSYPHATATLTTTIPTGVPTPSCTGTPYQVQNGDTCNSIATSHSIATDRFITDNFLDYNCSVLTPGTSVCLGASCALSRIFVNETCDQLLAGQTFYLTQLLSWNPTIHSNCDNLGSMVGRSVCISPPGSTSWQVDNSSTLLNSSISFVVPSTSFTSAAASSSSYNYSTSFFIPTTTQPIATTALTPNLTAQTLIDARTAYCPFNASWYDNGVFPGGMPGSCPDILAPYCFPNPNLPVPQSTNFPAACLPQNLYSTGLSIPTTVPGSTTGTVKSTTTTVKSTSATAKSTSTTVKSTTSVVKSTTSTSKSTSKSSSSSKG